MTDAPDLDLRQARRAFERAAERYEAAAVLQREVADRLLERLDYIRLQPRRVLDLGAGTGFCTWPLQDRYPRAQVLAMDFAHAMLRRARRPRRWFRRTPAFVCADARALPLAGASVELIVSSLMLQWCRPLAPCLAEMRRVLAPGGLLLFTTFGPDTLKELRAAWAQVDDARHVHAFDDMHDVGDALLAAGFVDPVVDMEMLTVTYADVLDLMRDLQAIGAHNVATGRRAGLTGRGALRAMMRAYEGFRGEDGRLPATWEVVYGHAWVGEVPPPTPWPTGAIPLRQKK